MRQRITTYWGAAALVLLAGCGREHRLDVAADPGQKVNVEMQASNFAFNPNVITAQKGDTLVLNVKNTSGEKHNITVKNPSGEVIADKDMLRDQTITVEVPLPVAGVYPFYCDVGPHATLGMKGRIEVK
ncbi:MAG: plastocyanin/azurin family copper-binding protein [Solirubrobacterales bacterium]